jgi:SAM-dependent methyltransferase
MKCLKDRGLYSEGIDISKSVIAKAYPEIRENIHLGDLLEISLPSSYDMVLGMDIFEHYNPNKLKDYISAIYNLLDDGGYLLCNIPAFENDPVFGEVFKKYIKDWEEDSLKNRCFRTVHVDDEGYPKNGHLIGASSTWWVEQFKSAGFKREIEIEKAAHKKYDEAMKRILIARTTFYIFSKNPNQRRNSKIIEEFKM